jgi:hypothetical protein
MGFQTALVQDRIELDGKDFRPALVGGNDVSPFVDEQHPHVATQTHERKNGPMDGIGENEGGDGKNRSMHVHVDPTDLHDQG